MAKYELQKEDLKIIEDFVNKRLDEQKLALDLKLKEIAVICNIGIKKVCRGCEYKDFEGTLETIKKIIERR